MGKREKTGNAPGESTALQYYPQTVFRFDPLYLRALTPGARDLYEYLSYLAWLKRDLILRAAAPFAAAGIARRHEPNPGRKKDGRRKPAPATRSAERHYKQLEAFGLLLLVNRDHDRGNSYLVEPYHLAEFCWEKLEIQNIELSRFGRSRQNGGTEILTPIWDEIDQYRQNGGTLPPKWRGFDEYVRTVCRQNGGQVYFFYSFLLRGLYVQAKEEAIKASLKKGKRSPADSSDTPQPPSGGEKGVGHSADASQKSPAKRMKDLVEAKLDGQISDEEFYAQAEAMGVAPVPKKKGKVSGGVKSNFHASADFEGSSF